MGELRTEGGVTIADMEAGLELFGRGTPSSSDVLFAVVEPSLWGIQTALRIADLASELGIAQVAAVASKIEEEADVEWIREALKPKSVEVVAVIPYDPTVSLADRTMRSLLDVGPDSPAAKAIAGLADTIETMGDLHRPKAGVGEGRARH